MRGHAQDCDGQVAKVGHGAVEQRSAVVTQNNVIALARVNQIIAVAAKDQVGAGTGRNRVIIAQLVSD